MKLNQRNFDDGKVWLRSAGISISLLIGFTLINLYTSPSSTTTTEKADPPAYEYTADELNWSISQRKENVAEPIPFVSKGPIYLDNWQFGIDYFRSDYATVVYSGIMAKRHLRGLTLIGSHFDFHPIKNSKQPRASNVIGITGSDKVNLRSNKAMQFFKGCFGDRKDISSEDDPKRTQGYIGEYMDVEKQHLCAELIFLYGLGILPSRDDILRLRSNEKVDLTKYYFMLTEFYSGNVPRAPGSDYMRTIYKEEIVLPAK